MASFSKLSIWPVGYFRAYSSWLLRNRREVAARIDAINAEISRIGFIHVVYRAVEENGEYRVTEDRLGFSVTRNSSLGRLCRAYVANGGNPLDISPFWHPDSVAVVAEDDDGNIKTIQSYPYGGIVAPRSAQPNEPLPKEGETTGFEPFPGGWPRTDMYYPARLSGQKDRGSFDFRSVVQIMHQIRGWANQTIKERVQDIEWRIMKLCDLREQLERERDDILVQAFGGALENVGEFDDEKYDPKLRVQSFIQLMYETLYETNADGSVRAYKARPEVTFLGFAMDDVSSEIRDPLGL